MAKIAGVDVLLYAKVSGVQTVLGGQTGATLNREIATFEVSSKTSAWAESLTGLKSWSIECEGYVVTGDSAYNQLETQWELGDPIDVEFRMPSGGSIYKGQAIISEFPLEAPQDDAMTFSMTLVGTGALTKVVSP